MKEALINLMGGLNSDDDNKVIPPGDYRDLRDLRSGLSLNDHEGLSESILSPLLNVIAGGPALATTKYMGGAIDKQNNKVYLLVHEPGVADFIIEKNLQDDTAVIAFKDPAGATNVMQLDPAYRIFNARMLDDKLFWTDNNVEPRFIQIIRIKQYTANGFDAVTTYSGQYSPLTPYVVDEVVGYNGYYWICIQNGTAQEPVDVSAYWDKKSLILDSYNPGITIDDIVFIASPPLSPPVFQYVTEPERKSNNLRSSLYQFAYRWIYNDYRKSVFSPVSVTELPEGEERETGIPNEEIATNNQINISYETGGPEVLQVELIYRSSQDQSTWYRISIISKFDDFNRQVISDNITRSYVFYDDIAPFAISDTETFKPFHYVPQKSGFLEIIEDNHMVFGDPTEGYPEIKLNVDVEKSLITETGDTSIINMVTNIYAIPYVPFPGDFGEEEVQWTVKLPSTIYEGANYVIKERSDNYSVTRIASYTALPGDTIAIIRAAIIAACGVAGIDVDACLAVASDTICFNTIIVPDGQAESQYEAMGYDIEGYIENVPGLIPKYKNAKAGATHGLAFVYYDARRRQNPASANNLLGVYLDYYNDDSGSGLLSHEKSWRVKLIVNHLPPVWATHYHIVYTGNLSMTYWLQARIAAVSTATDYIQINVNDYIDTIKDLYRNFEVDKYEYQAGDRVRVIGKISGGAFVMFATYVDVEILGDESSDPDLIRVQRFTNDNLLDTDHVIEIYRPRRAETQNLYYEIGQKFEIEDTVNGRVHGGDIDQVLNVTGQSVSGAEVTVAFHDGYKHARVLDGIGNSFFAESEHFSDYLRPTDLQSYGWPKIENPLALQIRLRNRLRYGGILAIGTKNNQIADFAYDALVDLPEKHGAINGLQELGYILKVIQSHKLWSIYIKRTSSFNPDGSESILLTDQILGTRRPAEQSWGTQNPESVQVHERHLYFWDRTASKFIRDSPNGLFAVSGYKFKTKFRNITRDSRAYSDVRCVVGVNESFKEIFASFYWNGAFQVTYVFNEDKNRWTHRTSEQVDMYINFDNSLLSAINQKLFTHNRGANYSEYDGVVHDPLIKVVMNQNSEKVKIYKALCLESSHVLFAPVAGDIFVPANGNYPLGMGTRLKENLMVQKEGIFYGPIMKDINTPKAGWSDDKKILTGRELRGQTLEITLTTDKSNGQYYIVEAIRVRYTDSETS